MSDNFLDRMSDKIDSRVGDPTGGDSKRAYLSTFAPNAVQWVTGVQYWNVPSTFHHVRQYQLIRDLFLLRCPLCNDQSPEAKDCWDKSRAYLESENLFEWSQADNDFKCPKCGSTQYELIDEGLIDQANELILLAGMRSGKSFLGAHVGGYVEHVLRVISARGGKQAIPRLLGQAPGETFEVSFAASTATQARDTIYAKYRSMRNNSPWIEKAVDYIKELENEQIGTTGLWAYSELDDVIRDGYLQVRFNRLSSNSSGIAGKTRIFGAIDELARLSVSESKTSAKEMYRVMNQSLKTVRSAVRRLSLPNYFGLMLNVTSPMAVDDEAMVLYNKAAKGQLKKTQYWKGATWEFNPDLTREDFDEEFEKDAVGAMRDFGAQPPLAATPLFDSPLRFWKCVDYTRKPLATFDVTHITDPTGKDYVGSKVNQCDYNFVDQHYVFCDAGQTFDSFSVVIAHGEVVDDSHFKQAPKRITNNNVVIPEGGMHITDLPTHPDSPLALGNPNLNNQGRYQGPPNMSGENLGRLITVYDAICRIVPTKDREIYFNSILGIIKDLKKKIKIATVCFDQWQSVHLIQAIRDMGIQSSKVKLKSEDFMKFTQEVYNDKVNFLPPNEFDNLILTEDGVLEMDRTEEFMEPESVGLVELLKLERSPDLKKVLAPKKGGIRGRGSDDIARCMIGADLLVKDAVVNKLDTGRRRELHKRLNATGANFQPTVFRPGGKVM